MTKKQNIGITILLFVGGTVLGMFIFQFSSKGPDKITEEATSQTAVLSLAGKSSEQTGTSQAAEVDWCFEHRVPESQCTLCNPELVEKSKLEGDWCVEHGVPEAHCYLCHPNLSFPQEPKAKLDNLPVEVDWCFEHRVPESQCTLCNPELVEKSKLEGDWCVEHGLPEAHCYLCHPNLSFPQEPKTKLDNLQEEISVFFPPNQDRCATDEAIIRFASTETVSRAGLSVESVIDAVVASAVEASAEIVFDETKKVAITSTVSLTVTRWLVDPGEEVAKGRPIAEAESPEIARLKGEYLEGISDLAVVRSEFNRMTELFDRQLAGKAEYETVAAKLQSAEAHAAILKSALLAAGITENEIMQVESDKSLTPRFFIRASASGILIERTAALGEFVSAGSMIATIADGSAFWIEAQVREKDMPLIRKGQKAEFSMDGNSYQRVAGEVIWVAPFFSDESRTATVRARVTGDAGELQANQFGRATFFIDAGSSAVMAPRDAVQWEGCCNVVFVQEAIDRYRPRKVRVAAGEGEYYRIVEGLKAGERVVVKGSYLLKTELKKSSIGAGCCGLEAKS